MVIEVKNKMGEEAKSNLDKCKEYLLKKKTDILVDGEQSEKEFAVVEKFYNLLTIEERKELMAWAEEEALKAFRQRLKYTY